MKITISETKLDASTNQPLELEETGASVHRLTKTDVNFSGNERVESYAFLQDSDTTFFNSSNAEYHSNEGIAETFSVQATQDANNSEYRKISSTNVDSAKNDLSTDIYMATSGGKTTILAPGTTMGSSPNTGKFEMIKSSVESAKASSYGETTFGSTVQDSNPTAVTTGNFWETVGESTLNSLAKNPLVTATSDAFNAGADLANVLVGGTTKKGNVTDYDKSMLSLEQWKAARYKEFHTDDWNGSNFLNHSSNTANELMSTHRGSLGDTTGGLSNTGTSSFWKNLGSSVTNTLAGTETINAVKDLAGNGDGKWNADTDEILALNTVTRDTIYTSKPGIRFKAKDGVEQNITGESTIMNGSDWGNALSALRKSVLNNDYDYYFRAKQETYTYTKDGKKTVAIENEKTGSLATYNNGSWNYSDTLLGTLSSEEAGLVGLLKNRNTFNKILGYLYIRPFYAYPSYKSNYDGSEQKPNDGGFGIFDIPFEFTPQITESGMQANYQQETLLGRLGQFHVYTGTNLSTVNIELQYIALAPDNINKYDQDTMAKQYSTNIWEYYWTDSKIEELELKLRSLVLANYVDGNYLIKPPLVEIHLEANGSDKGRGGNAYTIGDLYKYPGAAVKTDTTLTGFNNSKVGSDYLAYSTAISGSNRHKKYVVNSAQIDKINDTDIAYPSLYETDYSNGFAARVATNNFNVETGDGTGARGYARRRAFKATLQLTEVTENFLDLVPDFRAYYDAWCYKNAASNISDKLVTALTGSDNKQIYAKVKNQLDAAKATATSTLVSVEDRIADGFDKAKQLAQLYYKSFTTTDGKELNYDFN